MPSISFTEALATRARLGLFACRRFTGLCWWTKYNGWLPLAIGLAGLVPWKLWGDLGAPRDRQSPWLSLQRGLRQLPGPLVRWSIMALIAFLIWLPWVMSLADKGGYTAVAANHRGYVVGLAEWTTSFAIQARKLSLLGGIPTGCSLLVVLAVSIARLRQENRRFTWNMLLWNDVLFFALPVVGLVCVMDGSTVILVALGGIGVVIGVSRRLAGQAATRLGETDPAWGTLAASLLTAWFIGLLVTIPLYTLSEARACRCSWPRGWGSVFLSMRS